MMTERSDGSPRERARRHGPATVATAIIVVVVIIVIIWVAVARQNDLPAPVGSPDQIGHVSAQQAAVTNPVSDELQEESASGSSEDPSATAQVVGLPLLLDLGAAKCVPCKMMAPILDELREAYVDQFKVEFVDVWKDPAPGKQHGIRVIPTQIFFDEYGEELFRHQGFMSREDILTKWREFGYEFEG